MSQTQFDSEGFVELVLAEFPQLGDDFREHRGLHHLQMMEFALFTEKACKDQDWTTVERCLQIADRLLRFGTSDVNDAVYVSYLETLPRKGEVHDRLKAMMTSELRKGWYDILDYLAKVKESRERDST